ncbi:MAG: hypothetical protein QOE58_2462 [Actinomycetota bacterium]|jgi:hypothetical protein|nr:hypothetical protein [Actinomycetota bacterium]
MYAGQLRLLRALIVSATCVALSLTAHIVDTGPTLPSAPVAAGLGLLITTLLLTLVLMALSGQRWTLGRSLVALGSGQIGLHAIFTVLFASHHHPSPAGLTGQASMAVCHAAAALLIGIGITVNESALDTYFCVAASLVGSGVAVLLPWQLARRLPAAGVIAAGDAGDPTGRGGPFARWQRPRILTGLVELQCLSRRGPPAFALAS